MPICLSRLPRIKVHTLRDCAEHAVGIALLIDGLSQECSRLKVAQNLGKTPDCAVCGNFKMLDALRRGYQRDIADSTVSRIKKHVFSLCDQRVNCLALHEFRGASRGGQDLLKPQYMLFRLVFVKTQCSYQLLI